MEQIHVKLPWHVVRFACMIGVERQLAGQGKPGRYGAIQNDGWRLDIIGACGEAAVAQHFNYYWDGNMGNFAAKDVGFLQVRANGREDGDLILHPNDKDEDKFILVIAAKLPMVVLAGWLTGAEGKLEKWKRLAKPGDERPPAFYVPQSALHSMAKLVEESTESWQAWLKQSKLER
jgi:hypothetical protein